MRKRINYDGIFKQKAQKPTLKHQLNVKEEIKKIFNQVAEQPKSLKGDKKSEKEIIIKKIYNKKNVSKTKKINRIKECSVEEKDENKKNDFKIIQDLKKPFNNVSKLTKTDKKNEEIDIIEISEGDYDKDVVLTKEDEKNIEEIKKLVEIKYGTEKYKNIKLDNLELKILSMIYSKKDVLDYADKLARELYIGNNNYQRYKIYYNDNEKYKNISNIYNKYITDHKSGTKYIKYGDDENKITYINNKKNILSLVKMDFKKIFTSR